LHRPLQQSVSAEHAIPFTAQVQTPPVQLPPQHWLPAVQLTFGPRQAPQYFVELPEVVLQLSLKHCFWSIQTVPFGKPGMQRPLA
jgi:hypothetical protein